MNEPTSGMQPSDWIALSLGLAAFVVSIWSAWISRESNRISRDSLEKASQQRVAEFRKEWVEDLRTKLAELHSLSVVRSVSIQILSGLKDGRVSASGATSEKEYLDQVKASMPRTMHLRSYIKMMLNPNEQAHDELSSLVDAVSQYEPEDNSLKSLLLKSREVLKIEWNRLKNEIK